jgi:hypothetical protein
VHDDVLIDRAIDKRVESVGELGLLARRSGKDLRGATSRAGDEVASAVEGDRGSHLTRATAMNKSSAYEPSPEKRL